MSLLTAVRPATPPIGRVNGSANGRATRRWVGWSLFGLLAASAVLYGVNVASSGYSDYYAAAAKSMSVSWKAFFFGAFDPQSTITLDKLSGFLIPQALSARIFGFSAWSLAVPQLLEGLITIMAAFYIIRRWIGPIGGLIGAAIMASTPLLVSTFSHPMEDGMLTMFTTLAIAAWQRCIDTGLRSHLVLAGVMVGLGFQAKMMQAWLVLPAMGFVYLIVAGGPLLRKARTLLVAGGTALAVSLSWMTAIALVPAAQRPYIDGTTNNNIFSMVFGYNGVDRFISNLLPGALGSDPLANLGTAGYTVGLVPGILGHTPVKLLLPQYASQIGWLYPLATAGFILGIVALRRRRSGARAPTTGPRPLTDAALGADVNLGAGVLVAGCLLLTLTAVMSVMSLPHTAYLASMALPLAALSAIGIILLWRTAHERSSRLRFMVPITAAVQTGWVLLLVGGFPAFAQWLLLPIAVLGFGATLLLAVYVSRRPYAPRLGRIAGAAGAAAALLAPLVWSLSTVVPAYAGTANDAYAGPRIPASISRTVIEGPYGIGLDSNRDTDQTAAVEAAILRYAQAHSSGQRYAIATDSWRSAAPMIMSGSQHVLPIGGFTSRVSSPSVAAIQKLVADNALKFVLLTAPSSKGGVSTANVLAIQRWAQASCQLVPQQSYGGNQQLLTSGGFPDRLYECGA